MRTLIRLAYSAMLLTMIVAVARLAWHGEQETQKVMARAPRCPVDLEALQGY